MSLGFASHKGFIRVRGLGFWGWGFRGLGLGAVTFAVYSGAKMVQQPGRDRRGQSGMLAVVGMRRSVPESLRQRRQHLLRPPSPEIAKAKPPASPGSPEISKAKAPASPATPKS